MHLTYNVNIKNLEDVIRYLELEEERIGSDKSGTNVYMASSGSQGSKGQKRNKKGGPKQGKGKGFANNKPKYNRSGKGKGPFKKKKKNVAKVKCYNYGNKGNFARDYTKPRKVNDLFTNISVINVSSSIFLTESNPL